VLYSHAGNPPIARLLRKHKADPELPDNIGNTPLNILSHINEAAAIELLELGSNPRTGNAEGLTPLHRASHAGYEKLAELLLAKGADVSAREHSGSTPLHEAAAASQFKLVSLLLAKGADRDALDNFGNKPVAYAQRNGHDMVEMLLLEE
jgi:ankyrin repeat protein